MNQQVFLRSSIVLAWVSMQSSIFGPGVAEAMPIPNYGSVSRIEFNQLAVERAQPIFWVSDANSNGVLDPAELAVTWGPGDARLESYVRDGRFTREFEAAYARIVSPITLGGFDAAEKARRAAVLTELRQGRPTLVLTTLTNPHDAQIAAHLEQTARIIERIYAKQNGVFGLNARIPEEDTTSKSIFFRNQGPFCKAAKTENDPACSALALRPKRKSGLYPESIQSTPDFCTVLEKRKDSEALLEQFTIVRHKLGGRATGDPATDDLIAVPYHVAYADGTCSGVATAHCELGPAEPLTSV